MPCQPNTIAEVAMYREVFVQSLVVLRTFHGGVYRVEDYSRFIVELQPATATLELLVIPTTSAPGPVSELSCPGEFVVAGIRANPVFTERLRITNENMSQRPDARGVIAPAYLFSVWSNLVPSVTIDLSLCCGNSHTMTVIQILQKPALGAWTVQAKAFIYALIAV